MRLHKPSSYFSDAFIILQLTFIR